MKAGCLFSVVSVDGGKRACDGRNDGDICLKVGRWVWRILRMIGVSHLF